MKIDNVKLDGKLILAPMSGITNLPFRLLCKKYGVALVYSEMINADAYLYENEKTQKRVFFLDEERPVGIQLMGSDVDKLKEAAVKIEKQLKPDLIDINIGCPAYNVMKTGSGASLLRDPDKLSNLLKTLSSAIKIPLTCKIRITSNDKITISIARTIEKAGAKALTVHGRTVKQKYSGNANWEIIKKIKHELKIPVVLNGDIIDERSAEKAFSDTKCDAVMIGRAAIGNPYLFKRINHYLKTGELLEKQSLKERISVFTEFLNRCVKYNYLDVKSIKVQAQYFTKGFQGGKEVRSKISKLKNINEISLLLAKLR